MTRDQGPELPPMAPGDRPQDPWLDGRDMRFEGYRIKTLEQGGEYPDTMPQAIEVTDAEGRKALYVPLSRDGGVLRSAGVVDALKRCGAIQALANPVDSEQSASPSGSSGSMWETLDLQS